MDVLLEQSTAAPPAPAVGRLIVAADPFWVQPAELVRCDVDGCTAPAEPEMWEPVDLDTGEELPGRFCNEHQLAWLTRPRETTSAPGPRASP